MPAAYDKEIGVRGIESSSEDKAQSHHVDETDPVAASPPLRKFEAPEFIRNMNLEERTKVETSLKRKIDLRLMPMIVIMCVYGPFQQRTL